MREIDNNKMNSLHFNGIQKVSKEVAPAQEVSASSEIQHEEISDLSNLPAASLGKSQVNPDSLEADMKFLEKNPQLVQTINKAIDNYSENHSEEETLQMIEKTHQEFVSK